MSMRIAVLPLDSRPANTQFPQRLAAVAGVELVLPPQEWLGTMHVPAQQTRLLEWLVQVTKGVQAAVFSWDALVYGGLIQSRRTDLPLVNVAKLRESLRSLNWSRCSAYACCTIPRLGLNVTDEASRKQHEAVRDYLIAWGAALLDPKLKGQADKLKKVIGEDVAQLVWLARERNTRIAEALLELSCEFGMRQIHFAMEDNALTGPHKQEAESLRTIGRRLKRDHPHTRVTLADGTDEAMSLLLARAIIDHRHSEPLPVQLQLHPPTPTPAQYTGLYESQTLEAGLQFIAQQLRLEYRPQAAARWLVSLGKQPQPDVFATDPARAFDNPQLLPTKLEAGGPMLVSDLCACNGANPRLAAKLAELLAKEKAGGDSPPLMGICGLNTNFNTLGISAAWLRLAAGAAFPEPAPPPDWLTEEGDAALKASGSIDATRRFALERLADDLVYQSIARPLVMKQLRQRQCDPLDFSAAPQEVKDECLRIVQECWDKWRKTVGASLLAVCGISPALAATVHFSFPWNRAFECQVEAAKREPAPAVP